jgi:Tol biopolymer transport system component
MSASGVVLSLAWSPDTVQLAYTMLVNKQRIIYVADINGANSHRLLNDNAADWQPTWIH